MKQKLLSAFRGLFDWKNKPVNVFFVAIPLVLLGFAIVLLNGLIRYNQDGDMGLLFIWAVGIIVLFVSLIPAWRIHKTMRNIPYKKE